MADFCRHCSEALFGENYGDLAGISQPADDYLGLYCSALCEGCGGIQVNSHGERVTPLMEEDEANVHIQNNRWWDSWVPTKEGV